MAHVKNTISYRADSSQDRAGFVKEFLERNLGGGEKMNPARCLSFGNQYEGSIHLLLGVQSGEGNCVGLGTEKQDSWKLRDCNITWRRYRRVPTGKIYRKGWDGNILIGNYSIEFLW